MALRLVLFIIGIIVALNGAVWALQGAYVVPATFMRGPEWIAIGSVLFVVGALMVFKSLRDAPAPTSAP